MRIIECVPNFSEGRDRRVIDEIAAQAGTVPGAMLLDVDPGADANRTVMTIAGEAAAVVEAAFRMIRAAARLVDMRLHTGAHPRMGATDVCPLVPVRGVTMEECVELSRGLGRRVGEELGIPVYLYARSASAPGRRNLADVRRGEYEGLAAKLAAPGWEPDFGPARPDERAGATAIGARPFLIAYNVNLNSTDVRHARRIAARLREREDGTGLPACRAIGWEMPQYGCVQVSMNLTDHQVTPMHAAFEEAARLAAEAGLRATGSEVVGLVPLEALCAAGRYYLERGGRSGGLPEEELVRAAVRSLGLGDAAPFDPDRKILERRLAARPLAGTSPAAFVDALSSDSPAPGGGSAAALAGAMGAALGAMVANVGYRGQGGGEAARPLARCAHALQEIKERLLSLVEEDAAAYNAVRTANALPSKTDEARREKEKAVAEALRACLRPPAEMMRLALSALEQVAREADRFPPVCASDTACALHLLVAAFSGARAVVRVNLSGRGALGEGAAGGIEEELAALDGQLAALRAALEPLVEKHLSGG